ncbi:MAG: bifunctional hydroxymethylpyrimidine kinase/phosphomethylpyrimidine kinase [Candidatus Rhabdochlamydia sp.]
MRYPCLSIAGFDGSGGAGMQADLKTFSATGVYGMTVLTALPVQNTCGVRGCYEIPLSSIQEQLQAIFDDIEPAAIKIGMLFSAEIIEFVASFLREHAAHIPLILDPVMVAKSGDLLLKTEAIEVLKTTLIPLVDLITPNLPEARSLTGEVGDDKIKLAYQLLDLGCKSVLVKGGHDLLLTCDDVFVSREEEMIFSAPRIDSKNTHGTGCTLSAAITSFTAQGFSLSHSCQKAKAYLLDAIFASQKASVGKGSGPVHHFHHLWNSLEHINYKKRNEK